MADRPRPDAPAFPASRTRPGDDAIVEGWFQQWDAARRRGQPVTPDSLVAGRPELLDLFRRTIRVRLGLDEMVGRLEDTAQTPSSSPPSAAGDGQKLRVRLTSRYELRRELGRGGMGVVYAARDRYLRRDVAVKILPDQTGRQSPHARRFVDEAQIAGQLQHPGIPPVHDLGTLPDGRLFLAMKLIKGRTLSALLADPAAREAAGVDLLDVFAKVADAVGYAHSKRVVHRDLKPANVMVGAFGEAYVMDWGLAKLLAGGPATTGGPSTPTDPGASLLELDLDEPRTKAGSLLGTPAYMPPEQADGRSADIDPRTDVFSLGAILCELLTGKPPYTGIPRQVLADSLLGNLDDAHARLHAADADPALIDLAVRCLSADRADRPVDAAVVAEVVRKHRRQAEDQLRQAEVSRAAAEAKTTAERAEGRKRRRLQRLLFLVLLALTAGAGGAAWLEAERRAEAARAEAERRAGAERLAAATARAEWAEAKEKLTAAETALKSAQAAEERSRMAAEQSRMVAKFDAQLDEVQKKSAADRKPYIEANRRRAVEMLAEDRFADADRWLADAEKWVEAADQPLRDSLRQDRKWVDTAKSLAKLRADRWTIEKGEWGDTKVYERYREVYQAAGVVRADGTTGPYAADVIRYSAAEPALVSGLYAWLGDEPRADFRAAVAGLLNKLDPDPTRDAIRRAIADGDRAKVEAAVRANQTAVFPPAFVTGLGLNPAIPLDLRIELLKSAWHRAPNHFELAFLIARNLHDLNMAPRQQAIEYYRAAISLRPANSIAWGNLASDLLATGRRPEAISAAKESLARDGQNTYTLTTLGLALFPTDRPAASEHFRRAVQIDSKAGYVRSGWGQAFFREKEYPAAAEQFRVWVELAPDESAAFYWRSRAMVECGQAGEAADLLADAIRRHPQWPTLPKLATRYAAARAACRAADATGANSPTDARKDELRRAALGHMKQELVGLRRYYSAQPTAHRVEVHGWLNTWLTMPDFQSVRPTPPDARPQVGTNTMRADRATGYVSLTHPEPAVLVPDQPPMPVPAAPATPAAPPSPDWPAFWAEVRKFRDETAAPK